MDDDFTGMFDVVADMDEEEEMQAARRDAPAADQWTAPTEVQDSLEGTEDEELDVSDYD